MSLAYRAARDLVPPASAGRISGALLVRRTSAEVFISAIVALLGLVPSGELGYAGAASAGLLALRYGLAPAGRHVPPLLVLLLPVSLFPTAADSEGMSIYAEAVTLGFGGATSWLLIRSALSSQVGGYTRFARLWSAALVLACVSAFWGYMLALNGYSAPLRYLLVMAAYGWGREAASRVERASPMKAPRRFRLIRTFVVAAGVLALSGLFPLGHGIFLLAALSGSAAVAQPGSGSLLPISIVPALIAMAFVYKFSLTLAGIVLLALILSYFGQRISPARRAAGVYLVVAATILVAVGSLYLALDRGSTEAQRIDLSAISTEVESKLLGDRAPLWKASMAELGDSQMFIRPAGLPIVMYGFPNSMLGYQEWTAGAHNLPLETALAGGVIFAGLVAMMGYLAVASTVRFSIADPAAPGWLTVLGAAAAAAMLMGGITGQFVVEPAAGFWIWMILGLGGSPLRSQSSKPGSRSCN